MVVISFVNMKGGVSKTTLAVNVADCLVRRHDARVLIVDLDPQFNATQTLLSGDTYIEKLQSGGHTIVHVFEDLERPTASAVTGVTIAPPVDIEHIQPWSVKDRLDLLPGNLELHRLDMGGGHGRENRLKRYVEWVRGQNLYDFVIIDTPPTPSAWMSSALIASDYFIVPVKPEPLSATGIDLLRAVLARVTENYALTIKCAGVVLTLAEPHTIVFKQAEDFFAGNEYWRDYCFRNHLPKRTIVARMQGDQRLILDSGDTELMRALTGITNELLAAVDADD